MGLVLGRDGDPSLKIPETVFAVTLFATAVVSVGDPLLLRRNSLGGGSGTLSLSAGIEFSSDTGVIG